LKEKRLEQILNTLSFKTVDDLYVGIANKRVSLESIINRLVRNRQTTLEDEEIIKHVNKEASKYKRVSGCGVIVPGIDTISVSLANCCQPIPGDEIAGYISKGQGVKVHRVDCPNIINEKKRLIPVEWSDDIQEKTYDVQLVVSSTDRNYLLSDIMTTLQQCNASLRHVDSYVNEDNLTATTKMLISVKDANHLKIIMANLKKVRSVNEVVRTIQ
ncbi:MAG: (p)ppGpp synthetase, partial [Erysipelotrichaceae bacterium]|nr:(p)ppGpp synthetase [Erysipelotrichaceae bacterium]